MHDHKFPPMIQNPPYFDAIKTHGHFYQYHLDDIAKIISRQESEFHFRLELPDKGDKSLNYGEVFRAISEIKIKRLTLELPMKNKTIVRQLMSSLAKNPDLKELTLINYTGNSDHPSRLLLELLKSNTTLKTFRVGSMPTDRKERRDFVNKMKDVLKTNFTLLKLKEIVREGGEARWDVFIEKFVGVKSPKFLRGNLSYYHFNHWPKTHYRLDKNQQGVVLTVLKCSEDLLPQNLVHKIIIEMGSVYRNFIFG